MVGEAVIQTEYEKTFGFGCSRLLLLQPKELVKIPPVLAAVASGPFTPWAPPFPVSKEPGGSWNGGVSPADPRKEQEHL